MLKKPFPDALEMRRLKYDPKTTPEERDRMSAALRAVSRRVEAILLYEGRPDAPALKEDLAWAVSAGASFYLTNLKRMGVSVPDDAFRACAEAAERHERWFDAQRCYAALSDEVGLERVKPHLPGFKLEIPANKTEEK